MAICKDDKQSEMSEPLCNLLDPDSDPTDEQLSQIMKFAMEDVRARAAEADKRLWEALRQDVARVKKWNMKSLG